MVVADRVEVVTGERWRVRVGLELKDAGRCPSKQVGELMKRPRAEDRDQRRYRDWLD
jgi:hypothetical protein